MKAFKNFVKYTCVALVFICIIYSLFLAWNYATYEETHEYSLTEIEDGVYAYYQVVASSIPAHNYNIVTVNANGHIMTLKGSVSIRNSEECKLVWTDVNVNYGDTIDVYIPINSIKYLSTAHSR